MIEAINKKNGTIHYLTDEEWARVKALGMAGKYKISEVKPVKSIIPQLKIEPKSDEKKKVKSKIINEPNRTESIK